MNGKTRPKILVYLLAFTAAWLFASELQAQSAGIFRAFEKQRSSVSPVAPPIQQSAQQSTQSGDPGARKIDISAPQLFDYSVNVRSDVFGANLFTGAFAREGATQFNPNYLITIGDQVHVRLWGAFEYEETLTVDPKGNIFIPHAGPVRVMGVRNEALERLVSSAIEGVFKSNVYSYAALAAAQPVRVFVGGFVNRPGLYSGTSMDSLLHYMDQAGGIDTERGSFLEVQVKRGSAVRAMINLYDFLLKGTMPLIQLADGDVIFVAPRGHTIKVAGLAENTNRFEYKGVPLTVAEVAELAKPQASATHVRVVRNTGVIKNIEYYALSEGAGVILSNGDELEFTADKKPGTITVRVEGEHESAKEYVLPYGSRLGVVLQRIEYSERSDTESIQLFRKSVQVRQKESLDISLRSLESAALTARSSTNDEADLRKEEAGLLLQWVERAKAIEPSGQVVIAEAAGRDELLLENGDVIRVPSKDGLVLINGEVIFPNAVSYDDALSLSDYIERAGGYTQNAQSSRVVLAHRDGSFEEVNAAGSRNFFKRTVLPIHVRAGDQILVLPRIDVKSRQILKDWSQIIFQIAVTAGVVLGI